MSFWELQSGRHFIWINFSQCRSFYGLWFYNIFCRDKISLRIEGLWNISYIRHKCWPFWDEAQSACYNHFGSRSRSHLQVKGHMTIFRVGSITFELLEWFWNNSPQMFTLLILCACYNHFGPRSRSQLEIKGHMTIICVRSITFELLEGFWNNSPQMLSTLILCAERMLQLLWFKVKVAIRDQRSYDYNLCLLNNFWTAWRI